MSEKNLEEHIKFATEESNGLSVYLDISIKNCYKYSITFEKKRNDPRRFRQMADRNEIVYYPKDGSKLKITHYDSNQELSRVIDGKHSYFDINIRGIECSNMDFWPNLEVTVTNSPWSRVIPYLTVKAKVYDQNSGKFITYYPFKGNIDEYNKIIDIVKR